MRACVRACVTTTVYLCKLACACVSVFECVCVCVGVPVYRYVFMSSCLHVCMSACLRVRVHICMECLGGCARVRRESSYMDMCVVQTLHSHNQLKNLLPDLEKSITDIQNLAGTTPPYLTFFLVVTECACVAMSVLLGNNYSVAC